MKNASDGLDNLFILLHKEKFPNVVDSKKMKSWYFIFFFMKKFLFKKDRKILFIFNI
ncbi:hypothetical protein LACDD01_00988 [Lactococcus sp. DD01]|nr:hypothetical protein LACDD01_00988 [Lactococcus sp. DD01]